MNGILINFIFGKRTEDVLKQVQQNFGIPETGVLNGETLIRIDNILKENITYDILTGEVIEKGFYDTTDISSYTVVLTTEDSKLTIPLEFKFTPNGKEFVALEFKDDTVEATVTPLADGNGASVSFSSNAGDFTNKVLNKNVFFTNEIGLIPRTPSGLPPDAKPRKIVEGESIVSIINEEYLKTSYQIYKTPGDTSSEVVFEFPQRTLSIEDKDYRLKFYVNLIYYMNTDPSISYAIHRNDSSVMDYEDIDLDAVNVYDNETFGLNYKVFLEKIEKIAKDKSKNYNWSFITRTPYNGADGQEYNFDAPFTLDEGENLYLPSREFVEALYYQINFRPKAGEMYEEKTRANGNKYYDWSPTDAFNNFIDEVEDKLTEAVEETVAVYREAIDFYKNIYAWIIETMNDVLPRGMGFQVEGEFGIALLFGIEIGGATYLWRKVTPENELVLQTITKGSLAGTVGVGFGANVALGGKTKNNGSHKAKKKVVDVSAEVTAVGKAELSVYMEHEFPITPENTALISMLLPAINAGTRGIAGGITQILKYFNIVNIDPADYLTKVIFKYETQADLLANIGFGSNLLDDQSAYAKNKLGTGTVDEQNQDALNINNIPNLLKKLQFSVGGNLGISFGQQLEIDYKYENLPNLYKYDGRMPSFVKVQMEHFLDARASSYQTSEQFLTRFIMGFLPANPLDLIPIFNFNGGMALVSGIEYTRTETSENHTFLDYVLEELVNTNDSGHIKRFMAPKIYTGDFEEPVTPASEILLPIDLKTLKEKVSAHINFNDSTANQDPFESIEDFLSVFVGVQYRKRLNVIGVQGYQSKVNNKALNTVWTGTENSIHKNYYGNPLEQIARNIKEFKLGINFNSTLDIETTFAFSSALNAIKYMLLRLHFKASVNNIEEALFIEKQERISMAYDTRVKTLLEGTTVDLGFFDFLLNDPTEGLLTILEIQPGGTSNLPLISYSEILGEFIQLLDVEGAILELQSINGSTIKNLPTYSRELLGAWLDTINLFLTQTNTTIKFNTSIAFDLSAGFTLLGGARAKLAALFKAGLFEEILIVDQGRQNLKDASTDNPLYKYIIEVVKILANSTRLLDFSDEDERLGYIGPLLAIQTIKTKAE